MFPTTRHLLFGIAVVAALLATNPGNQPILPAHPDVAVALEGSFTPDGQFPGAAYAHAQGVRAWGSWSGSDDNSGRITVGPFPAPRLLRVGVGGYPTHPGNSLQVEHVATGEKIPLPCAPVGERWHTVELLLPASWSGQPIRLLGVDEGRGPGGWLAVTEPIRGGRGEGAAGLRETLACFATTGLLLAVLFGGALRLLRRRPSLPPHWEPLGAAALVAVAGYAVFWAYFLNSLAGVITSWLLLGAGTWLVLRPGVRPNGPDEGDAETRTVLGLTAALGLLHLAVLHLFPSAHDFYAVAANRFREALPGDNYLSHVLAERLFASQPLRNPADEWLSSDRPPLQPGWQLLTWSAGKLLQLDRRGVSGTAAVWLQLTWVAAAYGLLRSFRVAPRRAAGWVAVLGLSGFFLQNTTFTWPKLAAGAFASGAFAVLFLRGAAGPRGNTPAWSALFAGLGWLAHGGVAFSYLALVPLLAWRARAGTWRTWIPAAAVLALLVLPWLAYQKLYDPPGTKLLKWHLAGITQTDNRGTWDVIRDSYARAGARTVWDNKVANLHGQTLGDWRQLADLSTPGATDRRTEEFFRPARALTWWLPLAALALVLAGRGRLSPLHEPGLLGGWVLLTGITWCLLLFGAYQAVIHHGSYAMMLGAFIVLTVMLERAGRPWLPVVAGLQGVTFASTWVVGNSLVGGNPAGWPTLALATSLVATFVIRAVRGPLDTAPADPDALTGWIDDRLAALRTWWAEPRLTPWAAAALAVAILLRKPHALHTPQLWAEDGSIFLMQADQHGLGALLLPYMGYLHTLPRLIAATAPALLDPAWWPAFYNGIALLVWFAAAARCFSPRLNLPGRPWLALAFVAVPHLGEVFFSITNLQWVTALVLVQQALVSEPRTAAQRWGDRGLVLLLTLTGPFGAAFLPLFAWRWWQQRTRDNALLLGCVVLGAAIQAWFVATTGPRFEFQDTPLRLAPIAEVLARRLVIWPALGRELAYSLPSSVVTLVGCTFLGLLLGWSLRPPQHRSWRGPVVGAFILITLAGVYRTRPDTWAGDNIDIADRYFYIPRVLLAWLLIGEFATRPRWVANTARVFCLVVVVVHLRDYTLRAPRDYDWASHVAPIRQGVPARIPTLPEGWTLEYHGRPEGRR